MEIPKPMISFSLPFQKFIKRRHLPDSALGPPYFYYIMSILLLRAFRKLSHASYTI
ncbi:hypothetical protein MA16_Dca021345 [Dendrobium catenatum]|uniref:Uncharacterized protein n=1 Tax=Dendrobium catenatum TaxID=906689 RepID=A0A2I0WWY3_9ASPA|nr:hypothetical protein MA16_Dca021345 [Dendrobium catenatum]